MFAPVRPDPTFASPAAAPAWEDNCFGPPQDAYNQSTHVKVKEASR